MTSTRPKFKLPMIAATLFLTCGMVNLLASPALAIPSGFNIQGRLTDSNGVNRNGTYAIRITIFDAATAGNALWVKTFASVTALNGNFQVVLGDPSDNPSQQLASALSSDPRYLEIDVLSGPGVPSPEPPLVPRQQLVSVPYSLQTGGVRAIGPAGTVTIQDGNQAAGKLLTSDASGVATWQTAPVTSVRHYATLNIGCNNAGNPTDFVVTNAAFDPPLPPEITGTNPAPVIEASLVSAFTSAPGGMASEFGFDQSPGPIFNGTNPMKGIYRNVRINDSIRVTGICNTAGTGSGYYTFLFVAILNK